MQHSMCHSMKHSMRSTGRTGAGGAAIEAALDAVAVEALRDGGVVAHAAVEVVLGNHAARRAELAAGVGVRQEDDLGGGRADEVHGHEVALALLVACTRS